MPVTACSTFQSTKADDQTSSNQDNNISGKPDNEALCATIPDYIQNVKFTLQQAMKAHEGRKGIAPLIL
jgi:hypothetical protein